MDCILKTTLKKSGNCTKLSHDIRAFMVGSVVKNPPIRQEMNAMWVQFLSWEAPLKEGRATHSSILA